MKIFDLKDARSFAKEIRLTVLEMVHRGESSHIGSNFSTIEILVVLYRYVMRVNPKAPHLEDRDIFILSKGHAGAALYAVLAKCGFFRAEKLYGYYKNDSTLSGHVSHKNNPGVEVSTGSLGHGLPIATGYALAAQKKFKNRRVFVLLGDGEMNEGSVWEALLFAAHNKLDNLTVLIDRNMLQSIKSTEETLALEPLEDKFRSFGSIVSTVDGHDMEELFRILQEINNSGKPRVIIARTVKGKGVDFMENSILWHYRSPQGEEYKEAKNLIEGASKCGPPL